MQVLAHNDAVTCVCVCLSVTWCLTHKHIHCAVLKSVFVGKGDIELGALSGLDSAAAAADV